ncbi:MAG TPA: hypothetical protein DEP84_19965 [Chloroflexi bacterium]|nr:hypothetical protein [Chloroflexota bacterium]
MIGPIAVLSDLHFGEPFALLRGTGEQAAAGRARVDALCDWLAARGPLKALILLGDLWDLWFASFAMAREEGDYALQQLGALPAERLVYLPGNHDHHLLLQHQLLEQITTLRDDRAVEVLAHTQRDYTDSFLAPLFPAPAREGLLVTYPDYAIEYAGRRFVFHHGHHTSIVREGRGIFALPTRFILQRLEGIGVQEMTRSDLELAATVFFEMLYAASFSPKTRVRMNQAWGHWLTWSARWSRLWGGLLRRLRLISTEAVRGTSAFDVEFFQDAVKRTLDLAAAEYGGSYPCDVYVFGHTHRAGIVTAEDAGHGAVTVVNSGCWLHEPRKDNRQNEGTFLLIDPQQVGLYFQAPDLTITLQKSLRLPALKDRRSSQDGGYPGLNGDCGTEQSTAASPELGGDDKRSSQRDGHAIR